MEKEKEKRMTVNEFFDSFTISSEYVYYIFSTNNFKRYKKMFQT